MSDPRGSRRIKLILVAAGEIFGGAERQILTLIDSLAPECEVSVCLFCDEALAAEIRRRGVAVQVLPGGPQGVAVLRNLIRQFAPCVLHVHGYRAAIVTHVASVGLGVPCIKTAHGAPEFLQPGWYARLKARAYFAAECLLDFLRRAHIVFVTRDLQSRWPAWAHRGRSSVIYNGFSLPEGHSYSMPLAMDGEPPPALIVGRLERVKGVEFALRAFSMLPSPPLRLVVVGDGPERAGLERLAVTLGVDARVDFLGFQPEPLAYLSHASMLLMPSMHEGLPYSLLEAMGCGAPVVCSRVGGLAEVLIDGEDALLVPPADPAALAAAISMLVNDKALREAIAMRAHEKASRDFSASAMAKQYLRLYRMAAGRAAGAT